jgi:signal transduction histidine kinase
MTRKIIEYFGGRIWLDQTFSGGARFMFTLPMPEETHDSRQLSIPEPPEDEEADG